MLGDLENSQSTRPVLHIQVLHLIKGVYIIFGALLLRQFDATGAFFEYLSVPFLKSVFADELGEERIASLILSNLSR